MAPSMIYSKPLARNEIRLIVLQPGSWKDPILCQLETDSLLKQRRKREYKALSYAWGLRSRSNPPHMQVQDTLIPITVNLECALRHLRLPDEPLVLWVDAVCINQADVDERTIQVSRMGDVYSEATEVIIFLGGGPGRQIKGSKEHEDPCPAIAFTNTSSDDNLMNQVLLNWKTQGKPQPVTSLDLFCLLRMLAQPLNALNPFEPLRGVPDTHLSAIFEGLRQMLTARWWDRIWVVQEAVIAKAITLRYGNVSAPWRMMADAALSRSSRVVTGFNDLVPRDDAKVLNLLSRVQDIENFRQAWGENDRPNILSLLRDFSNRQASDERDKIYALLSLCDYNTAIWPDYSSEVRETYKLATVDIILHTRSLSVLTGDLGRKERQDLPSWVPDWSATFNEHDRRRLGLLNYYNACGDSRCSIKDSDRIEWHIQSEMTSLAMNLERVRDPTCLMPLYLSDALEQYKSTHPQFESVCDRLIKCCHPAGNRDIKTLIDHGVMEYEPLQWEGCLKVSGKSLGKVMATGGPLYSSSDLNMVVDTIQRWRREVHLARELDETKTNFIETILSGVMKTPTGFKSLSRDDEQTIRYWYQQRIQKRWYQWRIEQPGDQQDTQKRQYQKKIKTMTPDWPHQESPPPGQEVLDSLSEVMGLAVANRGFFVTDERKMGLGPVSIATGDEIFILPGGRMPFVLRNAEPLANVDDWLHAGKPKVFTVVGDCFLHGAMDGTLGFPQQGSLPAEVLQNAICTIEDNWMECCLQLREMGVFLQGYSLSISGWEEFIEYEQDNRGRIYSTLGQVGGDTSLVKKMSELYSAWVELRELHEGLHESGLHLV